MNLTTMDIFCGIGGLRLGFEQACRDAGWGTSCVFASEIDKDAVGVYRRHFGDTPDPLYDISRVDDLGEAEDLPDFDVMLASPPREDGKGTLFSNVAKILLAKRPKAILMDNFRGIPSSESASVPRSIMRALEVDLGYKVCHAVLNARNFGLAQNRPRMYIVGFLDHIVGRGFRFPRGNDGARRLCDILEQGPVDPKYYLSQQYWDSLRAHRERHEAKGDGFGFVVRGRDETAACLIPGGMGHEMNLVKDMEGLGHPMAIRGRRTATNMDGIRRLTPPECERLMGYPSEFTAGVSDTARWDALANSSVVPVIRAIAASMIQEMTQPSGRIDEDRFLLDDPTFAPSGSKGEDEEERKEMPEGGEQVRQDGVSDMQKSGTSCTAPYKWA